MFTRATSALWRATGVGSVLLAMSCSAPQSRTPAARTGSAAPSSVPSPSTGVLVGDLPAAVPVGAESSDRGQTGTLARVVLGARRERVAEIYQRYLRALAARDSEGLRVLFDRVVLLDLEGTEFRPREDVVHSIEAMSLRVDVNQLAAQLAALRPTVRSSGDLRRAARVPPRAMLSEDWLIDGPARPSGPMALVPRAMLIRWFGDEPLIVAISLASRPFR